MDLFDSIGETLGGVWDSASVGGEQWLDSWFDHEAEKVASAAPEENRVPQRQEPAKQPTGQPIYTGSNNQTMMIGGGVVVVMMFMFLMMRGK
ncbi:hypothetical protein L4D09_19685 [Photobacterium makurazakiensis]|uniref:hypothetical protein n=1 Tax=Photobacterium makurazakiensis TaxID=2910234 RepID=UPI003D0F9469